jgi:signal transduction histidine kinase
MAIGIFRMAVAAFLATSFVCEASLAAEPKRVLVLHSFGRDFKPWSEYAKAIHTELDRQSPWPIEIIDQTLLTTRSADEDPEVPYVEYLRAAFAKRPLDLIVSIGAPAANFVQRRRQQLFASTPMVLTAVEQRRIQRSSLTENDTVVPLAQNLPAVIDNILHVLPDTKTVAVVNGNSPGERLWLEDLSKEFAPFADRLSFIWYNDRSFADILKHAAALPPHSAIFWHQMNVDAAGVVHEGDKALPTLHAVANAPIFSFTDAFFGGEIVGGPMASVTEASRLTAAVAVRILGGEKAGDIKIGPLGFAAPKFDWRQMQRWKISEARLPPGSEVHFRELTLWDQYRWQISAICVAILLQAAMITGLLVEHHRRSVAETEARDRRREAIHLNRVATATVLSSSLAHELGQPLGSILLNIETARELLKGVSHDLISQVDEILSDVVRDDQRASEIVHAQKNLLKKEKGAGLQLLDLNDSIREVVGIATFEATKRGVALRASRSADALPVRADRVQMQQVMLNLVMNGMDALESCDRAAREVTIQASRGAASKAIEVTVSDSGDGIPEDKLTRIFDPFFTTKPHGTGLGLPIARTIIETHGGTMWAENRADGGAAFHFTLPLADARPGRGSDH